MGQGKEAKKNNRLLDTEYGRVGNQYDANYQRNLAGADAARDRADSVFGQARQGYTNFLARPRTQFSAGARSLPGLQLFANTGGLSDENISRMRGAGGYDEFARTGGLSDTDRGMIRSAGTASIPGFYNALAAELSRGKDLSGGGPGYNSQASLLSRDRSRAASDAALNAELGLTNQVNEGRRWGISGLAGAEGNVVDALQRGKMFGISGLGELDRADKSYDLENQGLDLQALGGLRGLRSDTPGEVAMYERLLQEAMAGGAGARRGLIQDRMQYNPNKSFIERVGPYLNLGAGLAGAIFGGGGGRGAIQGIDIPKGFH